ncbi:hypothetical protein FRC09_008627 [Ceratobasidium sp. 395]|nr:hypothetical protein FRC09_008627 [Ceratobasidium sp. 395]
MPKTNEERTMNELKTGQARAGNAIMEDPDDEAWSEMEKGARVWRVYVKETDRWDKELVDGRNKFIIESLKDLKPDYAESSAKALLAISQKLDAITSGQLITPSPRLESDSNGFSPPHASVVVNVLWLLSLSLSVAVSLIAMLAKEWCYKFMSGRSGQAYDQGRRRQQKWNGMEKWKMQEVLTYLPGLMHIALLLFAVGMCIHLWDVNIGVAVPVTAITSVATCVYIVVTVLPWFDQFCPYSTPVTSSRSITGSLWEKSRPIIYPIINRAWLSVEHPKWLESALEHLRDRIKLVSYNTTGRSKEDAYTPMDAVTSRMLAWMIVNCEDSHSVGVALQAIAGAGTGLPRAELIKHGALELAQAQLEACVHWDASSRKYYPKNDDALYPALRYSRACSVLTSGDSYEYVDSLAPMDRDEAWLRLIEGLAIAREIQKCLVRYAESVSASSGLLATAWAVCLQFRLPGEGEIKAGFSIPTVEVNALTALLSRHISGDGTQIPEPALLTLLQLCSRYMIGRWPLEEHRKQSPLPSILICIFFMSRGTRASRNAHIIAITLAAAVFAVDSYPGSGRPTESWEDRENRAVWVLRHYQTVELSAEQVDDMFLFGLIGLFPHISMEALKASTPAISSKLYSFITDIDFFLRRPEILTLPKSYNWSTHLISSHQRFTPKTTINPAFNMSDMCLLCALLLRARLHHPQFSSPALTVLYIAQSKELQGACIDALVLQPVTSNQSQLLSAPSEYEQWWWVLVEELLVADRPFDFIITFYLKLFVATIMLSSDYDLSKRQSTLRRLVGCHDKFEGLTPTLSDSELPSEDRIVEHTAERIRGGDTYNHLFRTAQLVIDFCHADPSKYPDFKSYQESEEVPSWVAKLQKIKDEFDSTLRPNPAGAASPCRLPYI